jgi:quercetin dioxygenase-like cupin family protein
MILTPGLVQTRDAATIHFFGTRIRILVPGAETGCAFCVLEVRSPAGNATPLHVHHRETETLHLLEGAITAIVDGRPVEALAGDTVVLPPNVPHRLTTGRRDTRTLLFCTPAGFDDFVRTVGTETQVAADPVAMARAIAVAAEFGIDVATG